MRPAPEMATARCANSGPMRRLRYPPGKERSRLMNTLAAPSDIPVTPDPSWLSLAQAVQSATGLSPDGLRDWTARSAEIPGMESLPPVFAAMAWAITMKGDSCRHYFVKQGGRWVCTMCGASQ